MVNIKVDILKLEGCTYDINIYTWFDLTLRNAVMKTFPTNISFSDLMLGLEGRIFLLQIFQNYWTTYFPELLKINFLLKTIVS